MKKYIQFYKFSFKTKVGIFWKLSELGNCITLLYDKAKEVVFEQPHISAVRLGTSQSKGLHKIVDVTSHIVLLVNIHVCHLSLPSLRDYAIVLKLNEKRVRSCILHQ